MAWARRLYREDATTATQSHGCLTDQQGAEMVEWVVVVVVLAVVASIVFGPNGVLQNVVTDGLNKISLIIGNLPTSS
jgi:Flp pilus assembly pilin Flp